MSFSRISPEVVRSPSPESDAEWRVDLDRYIGETFDKVTAALEEVGKALPKGREHSASREALWEESKTIQISLTGLGKVSAEVADWACGKGEQPEF
jgi:hypothetical protein